MNFIINDHILYNEKEGTLAQSDNPEEKVVLLRPTCRLLSIFVRNNNSLLARDRLLNDVWVDYGLKSSNNNLNNYISGLRKSLTQFGGEELLVTYPRQGFKFVADSIKETSNSKELITEITTSATPVIPSADKNSNKKSNRFYFHRLILIVAACLIPLSVLVLYKNSSRISITSLGQYKKCKIYTMNKGGSDVVKIKWMIQNMGFDCETASNIYYYEKVRNDENDHAAELITSCPVDTLVPCKNNYFYK